MRSCVARPIESSHPMGGRDKRAVLLKESAGVAYSFALGLLRGEQGVTPRDASCLIAAWARVYDVDLAPGKPCRCECCAQSVSG
jgi:hypothetical protein